MSRLRLLAGWVVAFIVLAWRLTCRYRVIDDPRPALRAARRPYIYALLHAHQAAAVLLNDDHCMAAMVSRSRDGDLLVPSLALRRVTAVRGSSRSRGRDKGGRAALAELAQLLRRGVPALLAVDGPQGPRNHVHIGIANLARDTGAVVLPVVVVPSRRWILSRTWDRMQLPKPFSTITLCFAAPICPQSHPTADSLRRCVSERLGELERLHDSAETTLSHGRSSPPSPAPA